MDTRRLVLFAALGLICYSLWMSWQHDYPVVQKNYENQAVGVSKNDALLPVLAPQKSTSVYSSDKNKDLSEVTSTPKSLISVKTDVLALKIDPNNGNIIQVELLQYPVDASNPHNPFPLLYDNPGKRYVANSSLVKTNNNITETLDLNYQAEQQNFVLGENEKTLTVNLTARTAEGIEVKKQFVFEQGSYLINVDYLIENPTPLAWESYLNTQLVQSSPVEDSSSMFHVGSYTGASYSVPAQHRYQKVSYKQMNKANLSAETPNGWVAMQQHYFLSAWIPEDKGTNVLYTRAANDTYTIGMISAPVVVQPGQTEQVSAKLYVGPEDTAILKSIAPGLELTVDYGWLWFISSALFALMKAIHSFVGNWGWSIILVTVLIKLIFYKLSATSYKSMAGMRNLQPKLQALRERYGDDKAKISQATMDLYRQEKVNPLGGCLPIVIQIPVFIALYWVLLESVELRQAPFIFWINDLAAPDAYHVLPVIMGITMWIQQRLNPAPPDPMQAKLMMLLPVFFTAIFWSFPSGLVLYWIVNNTLSILQQWYITRKYSGVTVVKKSTLAIK